MNTRLLLAILVFACGAARAFPVNINNPIGEAIVEYRNDISGHYVMLWDRTEIDLVEAGKLGPGWQRTGYVYGGFNVSASYVPGNRMCRFYAPGPNSHFLTARAYECEGLRRDPASGWIYERDDVSVLMPDANGSCDLKDTEGYVLTPVYRLYNNRAAFNDTNHRHVADPAIRAQLVAEGWIDEGVAFCSAGYSTPDTEREILEFGANPSLEFATPATCEESTGPAALQCLEVTGLAPMPTAITRYIPPVYNVPNPQYPAEADAVTGFHNAFGDCINTSLGAEAGGAIAQASFMQSLCRSAALLGLHIRGIDGEGGAASVARVYRFPTMPGADGVDSRFLPWASPTAHSITLTVELIAKTVSNGFAGGKAQGEGIIRFRDTAGGHELSVAYRIYDTNPAPDSIEYDPAARMTRIVTAFRQTPLVGELVHGNFIACSGPDCHQGLTAFRTRMTRDEFAAALALARAEDPALSREPADYMVSSFQARNETTLDGELGVTIGLVRLQAAALLLDLPPP